MEKYFKFHPDNRCLYQDRIIISLLRKGKQVYITEAREEHELSKAKFLWQWFYPEGRLIYVDNPKYEGAWGTHKKIRRRLEDLLRKDEGVRTYVLSALAKVGGLDDLIK